MKTICIYHSRDLDGWMSAAIVKKWFVNNHRNDGYIVEQNKGCANSTQDQSTSDIPKYGLYFLGWDYGDEIPNLERYDKVIMCDISLPVENMLDIQRRTGDLIWIDHHISAINSLKEECRDIGIHESHVSGKRDTKFAACELTWKHFFPNEDMPETVRLLGRYDCFEHKGTDEEQKVLEFQYAARAVWNNYGQLYAELNLISQDNVNEWERVEAMIEMGEGIYKYLVAEAQQDYKKVYFINFGKYHFGILNKQRFNPINFGINYHKDGYDGFACFHYEKGKGWCFSLYNDNGEVDCSVIAKQYEGGGHKGAAGFIIDNLNEVIK